MKAATALEKRHLTRVAGLPCLVCGDPATVHHVTASIHGGRLSRRHDRVTPLCPPHHQAVFDPYASAPISVERLGHRGFYQEHGIDLLEAAERLWNETLEQERRAA